MAQPAWKRKIEELTLLVDKQQEIIGHLEKINEMHTRAEELSRQERISADRLLDAQTRVQELADQERLEADGLIVAQQCLQEMAERERLQAENTLHAHQTLEDLSASEIRQRDAILGVVLSINEEINTLQPTEALLERTLQEAVRLLKAEYGLVLLKESGGLRVRAERGFSGNDECRHLLGWVEQAMADGCDVSGPSGTGEGLRAFSCLTRERHPVGAIVLERKAGGLPFSRVDIDFLAILASQASAALNNSLLFNRIRMQNRELKRMIMLKNSFFEHLSRDLRRPLEELKALLSRHSPEATAEAADTAERLTRSVDRIMSIPALQKEANEMYLHHIEVEDLVREILLHLQEEVESRGLTVEIKTAGSLPPFDGNREILNTILDEVICNAIVYNRDGGQVRILLEQLGQDLEIVVEDSGIGIRKEERDRVFDRFYRSLSSYENHKVGAGLGLYIVRNFVEAYGGEIRIEDREGGGTLVRIRLPY